MGAKAFRILTLAALTVGVSAGSPATPARTAVVFELFTSEGCSSCPPADQLLRQLVDTQPQMGAEIIGLGMHVDYWDRQGWRDRFSSAALTERQQSYATRFRDESIYTPQAVVDGREEFVGSDGAAARRALARAVTAPHGLATVSVTSDQARVGVTVDCSGLPPVSRGDRADLLVAITEDGLSTAVKGGENRGRVLSHASVVRQLAKIGEASGDGHASAHADLTLSADWNRERLNIVGLVQERRSRTILASALVPLTRR